MYAGGGRAVARVLRTNLFRAALGLWLIAEVGLLALHLKMETAAGLTAGGTLAFGDDTINFWAAARLALLGRVADVYDFARFHEFQISVLGGPIHAYEYSYPPVAVLLTLPLGFLPYLAAVAAWLAGGWVVFAATVRAAWPVEGRRARGSGVYALALPAVLINWLTGQTGTWTAALLGGGLILLERRPVFAGILLGALVAKPQMVLLVPVALIAGRRWNTLIAGGVTAVVLIALSVVAFGTAPWRAFVAHEPILRGWLLDDGTGVWFLFVSVFVSFRHLPTSLPVAYAAQAASCLIAAGLVARIWMSIGAQSAKNAALVAASLFATPYLLAYDLVAASLVPLWLLPLLTRDGLLRSGAWASFAALALAPLLTPIIAHLTGVNIGWMLLLPAMGLAARLCNNESKLLLA